MPSTTDYQLHGDAAPSQSRKSETALILGATGPLLLAIAGSAIVPLPCAFGQMGIPAGTAFMVLVALANDHTTVLLVRAAARLRVSSYEEVVLCTIGPHGLFWARVSLVVLLFGTQCGSLAAIQETAVRAAQLAGLPWLAGTSGGHALLLLVPAATVVMPLSLLSLGEMSGLSVFGVTIMTGVALYLLYYAAAAGDLSRPLEPYEAEVRWAAVPQAVSTLGYAFYIQPCALPMLNQLPGGAEGARLLERALHLTFVLTTLVYLAIGASGLLFFGANTPQAPPPPSPTACIATFTPASSSTSCTTSSSSTASPRCLLLPQDVLQGFGGGAGAALSALFALYLMLCFPPMLVPLRETLVRLLRRSYLLRPSRTRAPMPTPPQPLLRRSHATPPHS